MKQHINGTVLLLGFCTTPALVGNGVVEDSIFLLYDLLMCFVAVDANSNNCEEIKKTPMLHCTGVCCYSL